MTEFQPGDRVKVEFEGVVADSFPRSKWMIVKVADTYTNVPPGAATRILPAEPTGLGAVVRVDGVLYVRADDSHAPWVSRHAYFLTWERVCSFGTPEVLSEGVTA